MYGSMAVACMHTHTHTAYTHYPLLQAGGCSHNWSSDKQRYTYSIRHLYGKEGRMVNYSAHSCQTLQNQVINPTHEGGCPFK